MSAKYGLPYIQLWADDLIAHVHEQGIDMQTLGARVILWAISCRQKPVGTLPNAPRLLSRWCFMDQDQWDLIQDQVVASWEHDPASNRYIIRRIVEQHDKSSALSEIRSEVGRKGGKAKAKAKTIDKQLISNCYPPSPSPSPTPAPSPAPSKAAESSAPKRSRSRSSATKHHPGFEKFWALYPRKVGKIKAQQAWDKLEPPLQDVLGTLHWQSAAWPDDPQFIPHPTTWLNRASWEDEEPDKDVRDPGGVLPMDHPEMIAHKADIDRMVADLAGRMDDRQ